MKKGYVYLILTALFVCVINLVSVIYIKQTSFPFITMSYTESAREFNSRGFDLEIPISDNFKSRVGADLSLVLKDKDDIFYLASTLASYVRSRLFHKSNVICDVDAILESDGEDAAICSGYSKLLVAVANSLGYESRVIWMNGHTASEIYFPEYGWVLVDTNGNLIFKDEKGNYASLLYVVENFDKATPVRLAETTDNDPDFLSSNNYTVYDKNSLLVIIEGTRLFDFDLRSKSPTPLLKYLLSNEPIARGIQYTANERTKLGNLRKLVLLVSILDAIIALSGSVYFIRYRRKKRLFV